MRLTDGERLITVTLADIMESLKLDREVDPALIKTLACGGDDWAIKRKYSGIFGNEAPASEVVTETTNILWMWGIVEHAIAQLSGAEATEAQGWHWGKFGGFDGNNDPHFGTAITLINVLGEFEEFKGRNLNSHSQATLPRYRTMYAKFDKYLHGNAGNPLPMVALRDLCG